MKVWTAFGIACLSISVIITIFGVTRARVVSVIIDVLESNTLLREGSNNMPFWYAFEPYLIALIITAVIGIFALYVGKAKRSAE